MKSPELDEHILRVRKLLEEHLPEGFTGKYTMDCSNGLPNCVDISFKKHYIRSEHKKVQAAHVK